MSESDSLTFGEVIEATAPFNTLIGDGHFYLRPAKNSAYTKQEDDYDYAVRTVTLSDGSVVLREALSVDSVVYPAGSTLQTLQGIPTEELLGSLGLLAGVDDHANPQVQRYRAGRALISLFQQNYGFQDSIALQLLLHSEKGDSSALAVVYPTRSVIATDSVKRAKPKRRHRRKRKREDARAAMKAALKLELTEKPGIWQLSVRTFSGSYYKGVNEYRYVRQLFDSLQQVGAQGLIIDVRSNTGGALDFVEYIAGFLLDQRFVAVESATGYHSRAVGSKRFQRFRRRATGVIKRRDTVYIAVPMAGEVKPRKPRRQFTGPVAVLTNELSFSGATVLASLLQREERAVVVGRVAGGSAERMYAGFLFQNPVGPPGRYVVNLPLYYMDMPGTLTGNVVPDIIVPLTREDVAADRDAALARAEELLEGQIER